MPYSAVLFSESQLELAQVAPTRATPTPSSTLLPPSKRVQELQHLSHLILEYAKNYLLPDENTDCLPLPQHYKLAELCLLYQELDTPHANFLAFAKAIALSLKLILPLDRSKVMTNDWVLNLAQRLAQLAQPIRAQTALFKAAIQEIDELLNNNNRKPANPTLFSKQNTTTQAPAADRETLLSLRTRFSQAMAEQQARVTAPIPEPPSLPLEIAAPMAIGAR